MNYESIISGKALIEVRRSRYDDLIAQEKELKLLKTALSELSGYSDVSQLKKIFGIKEKE